MANVKNYLFVLHGVLIAAILPQFTRSQIPGGTMQNMIQGMMSSLSSGMNSPGGMPASGNMPMGGMPNMNNGMPSVPYMNNGMPPMSNMNNGMPPMPNYGMPQMPNSGMPQMPNSGMPPMPNSGMPQMPNSGMPQMPNSGMPPAGNGPIPIGMPSGGITNPFPNVGSPNAMPGPAVPTNSIMPPPPVDKYAHITSSHCSYLVKAPSPWGKDASPFKISTRSFSRQIKRGQPIEVTVTPFYDAFKFFNFTDFAIWAEPAQSVATSLAPPIQPANPAASSHLGVWKVVPEFAAGAGSMKCSPNSPGEDMVGSFEERMLDLLKSMFPRDGRLSGFRTSSRRGAAFLWYGDNRVFDATNGIDAVKFVAKVKSFGQWFSMESAPWNVYRPPPPPPPVRFQIPQDMLMQFRMNEMTAQTDRLATFADFSRQLQQRLETIKLF